MSETLDRLRLKFDPYERITELEKQLRAAEDRCADLKKYKAEATAWQDSMLVKLRAAEAECAAMRSSIEAKPCECSNAHLHKFTCSTCDSQYQSYNEEVWCFQCGKRLAQFTTETEINTCPRCTALASNAGESQVKS